MRSHNSLPASRAHDAPRAPSRAAPRPAHFAPSAAPRSTGDIGRRPDGPRRTISVVPTPTARPISAAVSKSYCSSAAPRPRTSARSAALPATPLRSEPRPRDIVLGRRGVAVVAISHLLLGIYFGVQLELVDVLVFFTNRKLHPIAGLGQGGSARPN